MCGAYIPKLLSYNYVMDIGQFVVNNKKYDFGGSWEVLKELNGLKMCQSNYRQQKIVIRLIRS